MAVELGLPTASEGPSLSRRMAWLSGASRSYETANPFSTLRDVLRTWWGRADFETVEASVVAAGIDDPDIPSLVAHLGGV